MNNNNKRISDIIISKDQPRYNDLWLDVSEGEKNAVLKYKGNPLGGGGSKGSGSGCDCGGFKYNELPEPAQFREPTENDIAKFTLEKESLLAVLDLKDMIIPNQIIIEEEHEGYKESLIFYITGFSNEGDVWYNGIFNGTIVQIKQYLSSLLDTQIDYLKLSQDGTMIGVISIDNS